MTVKSLTEESYRLKDGLSEYNVLKKKVFELENAHEIMKDQLKVLEKKVETLQETKDLSNSENGDKCDKQFVLKWRLLKHKHNQDNISIQKCLHAITPIPVLKFYGDCPHLGWGYRGGTLLLN